MYFESDTQKLGIILHPLFVLIGIFTITNNLLFFVLVIINGFCLLRLMGLIPLGELGYENIFDFNNKQQNRHGVKQ